MRIPRSIIAVLVTLSVLGPSMAGAYPEPFAYVLISDISLEPIPMDEDIGLDDPASETWRAPIGIVGSERLEAVLCYSEEGHAVRFDVDDRRISTGRGIEVVSTETFRVPVGIDLMFPVEYQGDMYFAFVEDTMYELDGETLEESSRLDLGFEPSWHGNLWDRWSVLNRQGEVLHTVADEDTVAVHAIIPPDAARELPENRSYDTVSIDDFSETEGSKVIGEPILLNVPLVDNGRLVVVPTDLGIAALLLDYPEGGEDRDMTIGGVVWFVSYEDIEDRWGGSVTPIAHRPIAIADEHPSEERGKDRILLAAQDGRLFSILRTDGSFDWMLDLRDGGPADLVPKGIWPTLWGRPVVTGTTGDGGFIAALDPEDGRIRMNGTSINLTASPIVGRAQYIPSSRQYLVNVEDGRVYLLKETMELESIVAVPGGASTLASFVGNIVNNVGPLQGNYLAVITDMGGLYLRATSGLLVPSAPPMAPPSAGAILVTIVTDFGNFTIEIFMDECPVTAGNFKDLVEQGFYDGLTFHRVIDDFMIQGGCPNGDGTGGPNYKIPGEASALALEHDFGVISMANAGSPDTAGSQFFIVVNEDGTHHLDGDYAVFGRVVEGMELVLGISKMPVEDNGRGEMSRPAFDIIMRRVVLIDNEPPVIPAYDGRIVVAGDEVHLNGSAVTDNVGVANMTWTFEHRGETITLSGRLQEFQFLEPGEYNVTLVVTDGAGNRAEESAVVRVIPTEVHEGTGATWEDPDGERTMTIVLLVVALAIIALLVSRPRRRAKDRQ